MKKLLLAALTGLCAFSAQSYAATDAQWADQVVAKLKDIGYTSRVIDRDDGLVRVGFDTRVGDVTIVIDPETKNETMTFLCGLNTYVRKNQMANVLPVVNAHNAKSRVSKVCIDPEDGQLMISVWTNCETLPTGETLAAILKVIVDAAESMVPQVVDAR